MTFVIRTFPPSHLQVFLISDGFDLVALPDNGGGRIVRPLTPAATSAAAASDPVASRDTVSASEGNGSRDLPSVPESGPEPRGSGSTSASARRGSALAVMEGGATHPSTQGLTYVSSATAPPLLHGAPGSQERGRLFEMPLTGGSLHERKASEVTVEPSAEDVLLSRVEGSGRSELPSPAAPPSSQPIEGGYQSMGSVGFMSKRSASALGLSDLHSKDGSMPQSRQMFLLSSAAVEAAATATAQFAGSGINSRVDFSQMEPNIQRRTAGVLRMHVISSVRGHIEAGHLDFINEIRPLTCLFIGFPSLLNVSDMATHQEQLDCVQFVVCQIQEVMRK